MSGYDKYFVNSDNEFKRNTLHNFIDSYIKKKNVLGSAISIVSPNYISHIHSGYEDLQRTIPISSNTYFEIGCIVKLLIATTLTKFHNDSSILFDLDTPIYKISAKLKNINNTNVTCRQILNHTSGINDQIAMLHRSKISTITEIVTIVLNNHALFPAGSFYSYCHTGYIVAAYIIELISGTSWEQAINKSFEIDICNLKSLIQENTLLPKDILIKNERIDPSIKTLATCFNPAFGNTLYVSSIDFANIANEFINLLERKSKNNLSKENLEALISIPSDNNMIENAVGFCWTKLGKDIIYMVNRHPDFLSVLLLDVKNKFAVTLLANSTFPGLFSSLIETIYPGFFKSIDQKPHTSDHLKLNIFEHNLNDNYSSYNQYTGTYTGNDIEIVIANSKTEGLFIDNFIIKKPSATYSKSSDTEKIFLREIDMNKFLIINVPPEWPIAQYSVHIFFIETADATIKLLRINQVILMKTLKVTN